MPVRITRYWTPATGYVALSVATLVVFFAVWWVLVGTVFTDDRYVGPGTLVATYRDLLSHGYNGTSLLTHVWASLKRCLWGVTLGAGVAVPAGLVCGYYGGLAALIAPLVAIVRPIPAIAYYPLLVIFFGIGEQATIFLVAVPAFVWMFLSTSAGVSQVPRSLIQAGEMLGLRRSQVFSAIIMRAALPQILTGLKISLVIGWASVVAAELVSSTSGLGYVATDAATYFRVPNIWAAVVLIGAIGAGLELSVRVIEHRTIPWYGKD